MIVYNVGRRFFDMKADAEAYRVAQGLKPSATIKVEVNDRRELAALLDGLSCPPAPCEPMQAGFPAPPAVLDRAFIPPITDIPRFLVEDYRRRGYPI